MLTAAERRAWILDTMKPSLNRACNSLQHGQEGYKRDFDRRLRGAIDDKVTNESKLGRPFDGLYRVFGQDQHTLTM